MVFLSCTYKLKLYGDMESRKHDLQILLTVTSADMQRHSWYIGMFDKLKICFQSLDEKNKPLDIF